MKKLLMVSLFLFASATSWATPIELNFGGIFDRDFGDFIPYASVGDSYNVTVTFDTDEFTQTGGYSNATETFAQWTGSTSWTGTLGTQSFAGVTNSTWNIYDRHSTWSDWIDFSSDGYTLFTGTGFNERLIASFGGGDWNAFSQSDLGAVLQVAALPSSTFTLEAYDAFFVQHSQIANWAGGAGAATGLSPVPEASVLGLLDSL